MRTGLVDTILVRSIPMSSLSMSTAVPAWSLLQGAGGETFGNWLPASALAVAGICMVLRIMLKKLDHALATTDTAESAAVAVGGGNGGRNLHRIITTGNWLNNIVAWETGLRGIETAAFVMAGYAWGQMVGVLVAVAVHGALSWIGETRARKQSYTGMPTSKIARMASWVPGLGGGNGKSKPGRDGGDVGRGDIDPGAARIIHSALEMNQRRVRDVMVPILDTVVIEPTASVLEALDILLGERLSRAPIIEPGRVRVVNLKDLVLAARSGAAGEAMNHARDCLVVPEGKPLDRMLRDMQKSRTHLAAVGDEYGEISGIITIEDCIEEILGEIEDEHDDEEGAINHREDGRLEVDGSTTIEEVNRVLGSGFSSGTDTTIGGFLFSELGRTATPGDAVKSDGWRLTVIETQRRRILRVGIDRDEPGRSVQS